MVVVSLLSVPQNLRVSRISKYAKVIPRTMRLERFFAVGVSLLLVSVFGSVGLGAVAAGVNAVGGLHGFDASVGQTRHEFERLALLPLRFLQLLVIRPRGHLRQQGAPNQMRMRRLGLVVAGRLHCLLGVIERCREIAQLAVDHEHAEIAIRASVVRKLVRLAKSA